MSHFSVLVIGDEVEKQLAPFHEFECTGTNDEFVQEVDVSEEIQAYVNDGKSLVDALDYCGVTITDDAAKVDIGDSENSGPHKFGYAIVQDDKLIKAVRRTNPNRKWDWWMVGGRWSGFLKIKPGVTPEFGERSWMNRDEPRESGTADSALKSEIDFERFRNEAGERAALQWDDCHNAVIEAGHEFKWKSWDEVRAECPDVDEARGVYNSQPAVEVIRKARNPFFEPDELLIPREQYIEIARTMAFTTYAILHNGQWIARGDLGWFGMSNDSCSRDEWGKTMAELIDSLPDDTRLTVVDCHI